jgi:uncharacterized protein YjbI with pentapeptide repeats
MLVIALVALGWLVVILYPGIWQEISKKRVATLIGIGVALTVIIVLLAKGSASLGWTGFRGMTVRAWLELLIVPMVLVGIGLLFEMQQAERQRATEQQQQALADQRAQDEALQAYLNQMSQLMLERKLLEAEPGDPVHTLAQARTSTVILRLDAQHNESVSRFLSNSGLAASSEASARLLTEITLPRATLSDADLRFADLRGADLRDAYLVDANLRRAGLHRADLSRANLNGATLSSADLEGATLWSVTLRDAYLPNANLRYADLSGADLSGVTLSGADLSGAVGITSEWLDQQAYSLEALEGATMPNGQKYEDWLKSRSRGADGENRAPS